MTTFRVRRRSEATAIELVGAGGADLTVTLFAVTFECENGGKGRSAAHGSF